MWTRELAIKLVEKLEPELAKIGAHCALAGSVLYKGESKKDLDIIIYPHKSDWNNPFQVEPIKLFLHGFFKGATIKDCGGVSQIRDAKQVSWLMTPNNRRIDFFFLE